MGKLTSTRCRPPSGSRYTPSTAPPSLRTRSSRPLSSTGGVATSSSGAVSSVGFSATPRRLRVTFLAFFAAFLAAIPKDYGAGHAMQGAVRGSHSRSRRGVSSSTGPPGARRRLAPTQDGYMPHGISGVLTDAGDTMVEERRDLQLRQLRLGAEHRGVTIAPRLQDLSKRVARDAQRIDHHVVHAQLLQPQLLQVGPGVAAHPCVSARGASIRENAVL